MDFNIDIPLVNNKNFNNQINFGKVIGKGVFGIVFQGTFKNNKCAIKEIPFIETIKKGYEKYRGVSGQKYENILLEIKIIKYFNQFKISPTIYTYW